MLCLSRPPLQLAHNRISGMLPDEWAGSQVSWRHPWQLPANLPQHRRARQHWHLSRAAAWVWSAPMPLHSSPHAGPPWHRTSHLASLSYHSRLLLRCHRLQVRGLILTGNSLWGPAFPQSWLDRGMPSLEFVYLGCNVKLWGALPADLPWPGLSVL